jgi:hypothetical protein
MRGPEVVPLRLSPELSISVSVRFMVRIDACGYLNSDESDIRHENPCHSRLFLTCFYGYEYSGDWYEPDRSSVASTPTNCLRGLGTVAVVAARRALCP